MAEYGDEYGELFGGAVAPIEDHEGEAIDRLPFDFKNKETQRAWARVISDRYQRIENVLADIRTIHDIDTAAESIQDTLGEVLGISRQGFADPFYEVLLRTQASIVIPGRRTVEGMLTMIRALLNDDIRAIDYREKPIKTYIVTLFDLSDTELAIFPRFLKLTKPATYNASYVAADADAFVFDDATAAITVTGEGFADSTGAIDVGGPFAFVMPL